MTEKPEILFARMDIKEVLEKVEAMRAAEAEKGVPEERRKAKEDEQVIDVESEAGDHL